MKTYKDNEHKCALLLFKLLARYNLRATGRQDVVQCIYGLDKVPF